MKPLAILTVQHTGTHFITDIVSRLTKGKYCLFQHEKNNKNRLNVVIDERHDHYFGASDGWEINNYIKSFQYEGLKVFRCHVGQSEESFLKDKEIKHIAKKINIVTSLRDPLLACISMKIRNRSGSHVQQIDGFCLLSELAARYSLFALPVDLLSRASIETRLDELQKLSDFIGIGELLSPQAMEQAGNWPKIGTWKNNPSCQDGPYEESLLQAYNNMDVKFLEKELGQTFKLLKKARGKMKPFLERYGYKDLMW